MSIGNQSAGMLTESHTGLDSSGEQIAHRGPRQESKSRRYPASALGWAEHRQPDTNGSTNNFSTWLVRFDQTFRTVGSKAGTNKLQMAPSKKLLVVKDIVVLDTYH